ncbi:MAG: transporter substrate-binding domain-containing protein [Candidatus Delongbacteria bacterium]|jgi:two-component system sensor histidine kinase EvgS|nr:transporter substrate-binding domain-containing protein [Candidatus Delongbacteria bacterium]
MKRFYTYIIFLILASVPLYKVVAQDPTNITSVTITHNLDNPPFKFVNSQGESDGILIDVWRLWSEKTGIKVNFVPDNWDNTLLLLRQGKVDIHGGLFYSEDREQYFDFSNSIMDADYNYFINRGCYNKSIRNNDILAYKIGVPKGYTASYIEKKYPEQTLEIFEDYPALFDEASSGKIKVFVAPKENLEYYLSSNEINNQYLKLDIVQGYKRSYLGAVKKGNTELLKLVNDGLNSITEQELEEITSKWLSKIKHLYSFDRVNGVIKFSKEEKEWLEANKEITFGADYKWPPFDFADKNDNHAGLSADYIKVIEKKTGIRINVVPGVWSYIFDKTKKGTYEGISAIVRTNKREEFMKFSDPFIDVPLVIVVKSDREDINRFNDLKGKTIAVNKDSYIHEYITASGLKIFPVLRSSNKECIEAVSYGKADAYIGNLPVFTHIFQEEMITNLKVVNEIPDWRAEISIGVSKNDTVLLKIINKVLRSIPEKKNRDFRKKWFGESILTSREIQLSRREHEWLADNTTIKIAGDPDWPPNAMYDQDSNYVGIIAELWDIMTKRSGIKFTRIRSKNWAETLNLMKSGKIDIIDGVSETPERSKYMVFSDVLFTSQIVIIGRNDQDFVDGLEKVGKLKLGVQQGTSETELIKRDYPDLGLFYYSDPDIAYNDLIKKKIDLYLRHYSEFQYSKKEQMLTALKVVGVTEYSRDYRIGVSKYSRDLLNIINKSIATITIEEKNAIFEKWHGTEGDLIDYSLVWKVVLSAIMILVLIFYWNRRLSSEIDLRKKTEVELIKAKNIAEEATNAKSEFLANMSHEIRTPMNAIIGFTELMERTPLTSKQLSYISTIKAGGNTLLTLINDILDISKIEAKKMELMYSSFNIVSTIYEIEQFFDKDLKKKGLDFITEHLSDTSIEIVLDESRLRQIFFNLISNAIKFTNSGYIKLTTEYSNFKDNLTDINIIVEDSGIGINKENIAKIFEPFIQVGESKIKRITKGTGLGLAITHSLTKMMNGTIHVQSEIGEGTKFTIDFYDVTIDGKKHGIISNGETFEDVVFEKKKILIADDVESNRVLIKELCEEQGFEIYEAQNGKEAVDLAKLYVPDVILMDIRMPEMDGYEATDIIKRDQSLVNIPIVAVTASVMASESSKLESSKFNGYIRKPISRKELLSKFKEFLPFTVKQMKQEIKILDDKLKNPNKFYQELTGELFKTYKSSIEKQNLDEIKNFSIQLEKLAEEHNSTTIIKYAKDIGNAVNNFDIEIIKNLLNNYIELIKKIR